MAKAHSNSSFSFHLSQATGIGKTVNYVRKLEGEVGELAKSLVTKWKDMVADAEKAEKMKPPVPLFSKPQVHLITQNSR